MTTASLRLPTTLYLNTKLDLALSVVSTNHASNSSVVKVKVNIVRVDNYNDNFYGNAKVQIYETNSSGANIQTLSTTSGRAWDIRASHNKTSTIAETNFTVPHNSDGTRTFRVKVVVDPNATGFSWTADENSTLSASITLPTIPRTATMTLPSSVTAGNSFTATISGSSGQEYEIVMDNKVISSRGTSTSRSLTIATSVVSSQSSVSKTLTLNTYVGGVKTGSSYATITVNAPSSSLKPSVTNSGSYEDVNRHYNTVFGSTSSNQLFGGKSNLRITGITGSSQYSSIASYQVQLRVNGSVRANGNSSSGTVNIGTLYNPSSATESVDIYVAVTDRNGAQSNWVKQGSFYNHRYFAPTVSGSVSRNRSNQGAITFNVGGTSLKLNGTTSNSDSNPVSSKVQMKASNASTWSDVATVSGTGSKSATSSTLSTTLSYEFRIITSDKLSTTTVTINSIGTEAVPLDLSPIGAGVGKIHSGDGANLQVGSSGISTDGNIYVNGEYSPKQLEQNTNLNNITKPNFYFCPLNAHTATMSNRPTDKAFTLQVYRHAGVLQVLTEFETSNARMFMRNQYNGSWGSWTQVNASQPNLSNYYTKSQTYAKSEVYAKGDVYTKTEANNAFMPKSTSIPSIPNMTGNTVYKVGNFQVCMATITLSSGGNGYYYSGTWTYPRAFAVNEVYCFGTVSTSPTSSNYQNWNGNVTMYGADSKTVKLWWGGTHDSKTLSGTVSVNVVAMGRG